MSFDLRPRHSLLLLALGVLTVSVHPVAQSRVTRRAVAAVSVADVRGWEGQMVRMERGGELVLRRRDPDTLPGGRISERLDQSHRGVRVFGGELVRRVENGQTFSVFGAVYPGLDVDVEPTLSARDATAVVAALSGVTLPAAHAPELMVLPRDDGGAALAYRARVMTSTDLIVYFIDAHTGNVLLQYSDLQTTVGTGAGVLDDTKKISTTFRNGTYLTQDSLRPPGIYTYDMKGNLGRLQLILNGWVTPGDGDIAADSDNAWSDRAAVDAHAYAGWTYDYFAKRFNRHGLDDRNLTMSSFVHPVHREDWESQPASVRNLYYLNAFYAGNGMMVYGEGLPPDVPVDGKQWNYFSGALDVVAHELTHGITDFSSNLIYRNESGALNEAFSDILGVGAEFFFQQLGVGYLKADYLVGEDLTNPLGGFRSMANPAAFGDPDHYSRRYLGEADNGGVHINSSIANHMFYLAVEGGVNRTSGLSVQGVGAAGREKIERVIYQAFTQMLPANATFALARETTLQAARDLYGAGSDVEQALTQAWTAVGVF